MGVDLPIVEGEGEGETERREKERKNNSGKRVIGKYMKKYMKR